MNRREFLQFLGVSGAAITLPNQVLSASKKLTTPQWQSLPVSLEDKLTTISGIDYKILIKWGDAINPNDKFGFNNDYLAFHALNKNHGILWANHEYVNPVFINGKERTKQNVDLEMKEVGGSLIEIEKKNNQWQLVKNSKFNRRLDANTPIPFAGGVEVEGSKIALGTLAGCAGGKTPWGTVLSCEENYDMFWGDRDRKKQETTKAWMEWTKIYQRPPEHYGWVVEINPTTGEAKKHTSLGRCAHECATITKAKNGKIIAYTGDDCPNQHLYKLISDSDKSIEKGKLYVASLEKKEWISLQIDEQEILKKNFKNQLEVLTHLREAAKLVGATPLDRPEDIEIDPLTGNIFIALTNNKTKNNYVGSILKIIESGNDHGSLKFEHENFLTGGKNQGFACPDNMAFDPKGNLWFTTDMHGSEINKGEYQGLGNNALYVFIRDGKHKGEVIRVAIAPVEAEFTGPCFSPDYKTLFLSVQHPGEMSESKDKLTSKWPDGDIPRPAVVTLQGPFLDQIIQGKL
ncbi:MAG: PhoX family phosphatase [Bacteriovoracaceae bacterium]